MASATIDGITMINFGMGSPNAAIIMDLLSAVMPKAVLFLGKCGGLKRKNQLGDLVLPIAAIRGEGTSGDYLPPEVPALPAFALQRAVSTMIRDRGHDYWTGTVTPPTAGSGSTTRPSGAAAGDALHGHRHGNRHGVRGRFRQPHSQWRAAAGLGPADDPDGVKTEASDAKVSSQFVENHIQIGIEALKLIRRNGKSVRHLRFDE